MSISISRSPASTSSCRFLSCFPSSTRISRSLLCFCSLSTQTIRISSHPSHQQHSSSFIYLVNQSPCPCKWGSPSVSRFVLKIRLTWLPPCSFSPMPHLTSPSCVFTRHPHKHTTIHNIYTAQSHHHTKTSARLPMTSCQRTTLLASPLSRQRLAHPMACSSRPALQRTMLEMSS